MGKYKLRAASLLNAALSLENVHPLDVQDFKYGNVIKNSW